MGDERVTPELFFRHYTSQRGISVADLGVQPLTVVTWMPSVARSLAEALGATAVADSYWGPEFAVGTAGGRQVSVARVPVGAPATAIVLEELIHCGARAILGVGLAGSLTEHAPVGTCLLPTSAVSDEGTSRHYPGPDSGLAPSPTLTDGLRDALVAEHVPFVEGPVWTTDAPYRETASAVEAHARSGVVGVDMETSAVFAVAGFRGVEACTLLVVSDELWHKWRPMFGTPELEAGTVGAVRAVSRWASSSAIDTP